MADKKSHPIRNSIIATVGGGIILSFWPAFRGTVGAVFSWLWGLVIGAWTYLSTDHEIYGWVIIALVAFAIPTIIRLARSVMGESAPDYQNQYTKDSLFGADWQWNYRNGDIVHLWCLCPVCSNELVYDQFVPNRYRIEHDGLNPRTDFKCERCQATRASLDGRKDFAISTVEREIRRKIRTGEWAKTLKATDGTA